MSGGRATCCCPQGSGAVLRASPFPGSWLWPVGFGCLRCVPSPRGVSLARFPHVAPAWTLLDPRSEGQWGRGWLSPVETETRTVTRKWPGRVHPNRTEVARGAEKGLRAHCPRPRRLCRVPRVSATLGMTSEGSVCMCPPPLGVPGVRGAGHRPGVAETGDWRVLGISALLEGAQPTGCHLGPPSRLCPHLLGSTTLLGTHGLQGELCVPHLATTGGPRPWAGSTGSPLTVQSWLPDRSAGRTSGS